MNPSYKANLGNNVDISQVSRVTDQYGTNGSGAVGSFAQVFDTQGMFEDSQLQIFNIVTYIKSYDMPENADTRLALLGKLTFGIGGGSAEIDFDWKEGNQISVAASFVRLTCAFSEVGVADAPSVVSVGAMLSSGSRASRAQNTRTFPRLSFDNTQTRIFPVPPFAHALNLFANEAAFYTAGGVQIRYIGAVTSGFSSASAGLASWTSDGVPFRSALANEDGVRIPESARFVELTTVTVATFTVTPVFTLSI
jgi:hypothetical protein